MPDGVRVVSGYTYRGCGLHMLAKASTKGRRPPVWGVTHLNTGHATAQIRGLEGLAFKLATEIAERLHRRDVDLGRTYSQAPVLLYDQTGIRTRWVEHLGWLNGNIASARSVSLAQAKTWLEELQRMPGS